MFTDDRPSKVSTIHLVCKSEMSSFIRPKSPFLWALSYFHYIPVMVINYIHETWRYCFIVSVKANLDFCNLLNQHWPAPSAYVWRRRPNRLLVNEGGSGPWQFTFAETVATLSYCDFHAGKSCKVLMSDFCFAASSQAHNTFRSSCSSSCKLKHLLHEMELYFLLL